MIFSRTVLGFGIAVVSGANAAKYSLVDSYDASNFFDKFNFFSGADPTHGFVQYVDGPTASKTGLAGYSKGGIYLGSDKTSQSASGRASTRVESKKAYTKGLFIADIAHMPAGNGDGGSCGLWPAFWMFGPNWPTSGEIDIIEGVHNQDSNVITLHTSDGCTMANTGTIAATKMTNANCQGNEGCGQTTSNAKSYGEGFNAAGGGVYAVEWTDEAISVWFWARGDPMIAKLTGASNKTANGTTKGNHRGKNKANATATATQAATLHPDSATFGTPMAKFVGDSCTINNHFNSNNLVFNIDFCGDWAGQVWTQDPVCSKLAPTCQEYVQKNPQAFADAYWLVNGIQVFSDASGATAKKERAARRFVA